MPPRLCCCTECMIAEDDFNRNGSDLGSSWTHDPGDWITVATGPWENGYAESQADDSIAIHNTPHPTPSESGVVYLDIIGETPDSGMAYRAIVNAVDKDSYHFAEYIRNGASDSILRLGISSGGSDTILESKLIDGLTDPTLEPRRLTVMIADNEFCATVSHCVFSFVEVEESPIALGYKAGFGGDLGAQFSHWTFLKHAQTDPDCPSCLCDCDTNYIPPVLSAHLEGTGRMSTLFCDIELVWDRLNGAWISAVVTCCNQGWQLKFFCPEDPTDATTAKLVVLIGCINSDSPSTGPDYVSDGIRWANTSSICTPISLVFGPFLVGGLDFACGCPTIGVHPSGTYTITITE